MAAIAISHILFPPSQHQNQNLGMYFQQDPNAGKEELQRRLTQFGIFIAFCQATPYVLHYGPQIVSQLMNKW